MKLNFQKAVWIYMFFILVISIIPLNPVNSPLNDIYVISIRLDYLFHFAIFILLMFLVWIAYQISFRKNLGHAIFWILFALIFSWITEGIQYFIPYRAFNINDLLANSFGVFSGSLVFLFLLYR